MNVVHDAAELIFQYLHFDDLIAVRATNREFRAEITDMIKKTISSHMPTHGKFFHIPYRRAVCTKVSLVRKAIRQFTIAERTSTMDAFIIQNKSLFGLIRTEHLASDFARAPKWSEYTYLPYVELDSFLRIRHLCGAKPKTPLAIATEKKLTTISRLAIYLRELPTDPQWDRQFQRLLAKVNRLMSQQTAFDLKPTGEAAQFIP